MRRPHFVGASHRGFTAVTERARDESAIHARTVEHLHTSHGQYLEGDSLPLVRHCSGLGRHRRMALKNRTVLRQQGSGETAYRLEVRQVK